MPSTSQIVKNLAEEIKGKEVKKNWSVEFCKRYKFKLKSAYLRNLNNLRIFVERVFMFILFFTLMFNSFKSSKNTILRSIIFIISTRKVFLLI
ncbi:hypothetical protein BDZ45DRAFT_787907 [Acephala macrosclerotiorum]|nr:hypothetical protein BDZ45DRAFT_787907 [Acephala macrosclerotiorum]